MERIVYENAQYQVVDARDWKMGFTVDNRKELESGRACYVTIMTGLSKADAIKTADGLLAAGCR